jgi:hypothetical protein
MMSLVIIALFRFLDLCFTVQKRHPFVSVNRASRACTFLSVFGGLVTCLVAPSGAWAGPSNWLIDVLVNNGDLIPGTSKVFNAYNQPSINNDGLVVFLGRGRGGDGQPPTGIFYRQIETLTTPQGLIVPIVKRGDVVPDPNNNTATFIEFPSFPRLDATSSLAAFRTQSTPAWKVPDGDTFGTSAVISNPTGSLIQAANQLGAVPDFPWMAVPGQGVKFDQFPGAPSPTQQEVVFKGNWTSLGVSGTGVYARNMVADGGEAPVRLIADSTTLIPGSAVPFGSTAPPSAAAGRMVFLGVDNEEAPTLGGLYLASLGATFSPLKPLVEIGGLQGIVGAPGLTSIGEGLSFTGTSVAFWGAWGTEKLMQQLTCPTDGNADLRNYCIEKSENKDGVYKFSIPKNQAIFVTDVDTLVTRLVAQTNDQFDTFLNWNFSGRPPGVGGGDEPETDLELARWRSTAFVALDGLTIAFKAEELSPVSPGGDVLQQVKDGIYTIANQPGATVATLLETGMNAAFVDPMASAMSVTSVGLERDGLRNGRLAFAASMSNANESWAGLYVATPGPIPVLGVAAAFRFSRMLRARVRRGSC